MIALEIRKLIIKNREDGVPVSEISRILHVSESAIYSICRKYKERKHLNGNYPGRKPRITEEQKAAVLARVPELGVKAAAAEAGVPWQAVARWNKAAQTSMAVEETGNAAEENTDVVEEKAAEESTAVIENVEEVGKVTEQTAEVRKPTRDKPSRPSRVKEIAEDLRTIAGDTVKEAVEITKKTAKKTSAKVKAVTDVVSREAERSAKEAKEAIDITIARAADLLEDTKTIASDTVKETAVRKRTTRSAAPVITIQSVMGGEITVDEILKRIAEREGKQAVTNIYIKAEENRAYYVAGGETGSVELWK